MSDLIFNEGSKIDGDEIKSNELPYTVTQLVAENGVKVYLVGTAHFSRESQRDVVETIRRTRPRLVMVELCSSRAGVLTMNEEELMTEASQIGFNKLSQFIKNNGVVHGVLQMLMLNLSAHITKELGMAPGGEFRAAFKELKNQPQCKILLGDRPISITLQRALASLSYFQRVKLAINLIFSNKSISKEDVEKCKQKDLLEELLEEMAGEFPAMGEVFVKERDIYLSYSLKKAASMALKAYLEDKYGSEKKLEEDETEEEMHEAKEEKKQIEDKKKIKKEELEEKYEDEELKENKEKEKEHEVAVVGVVGIGHCPGIEKIWHENHEIDSIITVPPPSKSGRFLRIFFRLSFFSIFTYGFYRAARFSHRLLFL